MDHSGHMSSSSSAAMPASTGMSEMDMGGMDHGGGGHGGMSSCKISMLWNWNTIDTCFISESWHVTSKGMFAGSCIGVILLVLSLEFLRRAGKEYDRYILAQHTRSLASATTTTSSSNSSTAAGKTAATSSAGEAAAVRTSTPSFRPNILQQAVRALLHMLQFAVAYFVMLLAMYYNGYFIICIFIGAFLGYFIFSWESFNVKSGASDRNEEEVTVCCG
ncbi:unnamed protein product [Periconia digitata]|uniref:Copper transport protein n=1 Tax=Periconia digitata TaxID=1303443 RepID=A0A9W4UFH1_9PLEO|nr:unnamed protein product [Periconia digitata]